MRKNFFLKTTKILLWALLINSMLLITSQFYDFNLLLGSVVNFAQTIVTTPDEPLPPPPPQPPVVEPVSAQPETGGSGYLPPKTSKPSEPPSTTPTPVPESPSTPSSEPGASQPEEAPGASNPPTPTPSTIPSEPPNASQNPQDQGVTPPPTTESPSVLPGSPVPQNGLEPPVSGGEMHPSADNEPVKGGEDIYQKNDTVKQPGFDWKNTFTHEKITWILLIIEIILIALLLISSLSLWIVC